MTGRFKIAAALLFWAISGAHLAGAQTTAAGDDSRFEYRAIDGYGKLAIVDVDNDGRNDIIQRGTGGDALVLYRHNEDHSLTKHVLLRDLRFRSDRIAFADIDSDGDMDLVTGLGKTESDADGIYVVWLENPLPGGDPTQLDQWKIHVIGEQPNYIKDIEMADFNSNGKQDVVMRSHEQTIIFLQGAAVTAWSVAAVLNHESHEGMDVADLTLSGRPDIILNGFWYETPDDISKGEFKKHVIDKKWFTPVEGSWRDNNAQVVVADFNGDGLPDVLISHSELPGYPISLYMASSVEEIRAGRWKEVHVAGRFDFCQTLDVGDLNGDGHLDILAAKFRRDPTDGSPRWINEPPYPIVAFYNIDGDGLTWRAEQLSENASMYAGIIGDVGSDGDLDVVGSMSYFDGPLHFFENKTADHALSLDNWHYIEVDSTRERYVTPGGAAWWTFFGLGMGDATGDGHADIVAGKYFYRNPGGDMTGAWERVTFPVDADAMVMVDVNGNGFSDVIAQALPDVYWLEALDRAGSRWSALKVASLARTGHANTQLYGLAQLVPGGRPEILMGAADGMYYLEIPDNPEAGNWPVTRITHDDGGYAAGDIDGDGFADVVGAYRVETDGELVPGTSNVRWWNHRVAWWKNPGDGSSDWQRFTVGAATQADRFAVADLNGNGRLDVVVSEERYWGLEPNANLYWFEQPDDPMLEWVRHTIVTQTSMNSLDVGDVDGSGFVDIVTAEHKMPRDGVPVPDNERVQIWKNDGKGSFTLSEVDQGKEMHLGARLHDMDGDGDLDLVGIAWRKPGFLHLWRNDAIRGGGPERTAAIPTGHRDYGLYPLNEYARFRLPIEVSAQGVERTDKVVEVNLDLTRRLRDVGSELPLALNSLRLVEVNASGAIVDPNVVFQFDTLHDFNPESRAVGTFLFIMKGTTPAQATRRYHLYFADASQEYEPQAFSREVLVEDVDEYEGHPAYKITTPAATYFFHKRGSAFASMIDADGNDWISHHPEGGFEGNYRGIPNIAPPGFHPGPGEGLRESVIAAEGPVRLRVLSETENGEWGTTWDIYPTYAMMTLFKKGADPYWILYEGTPGGEFNEETDYWVQSTGVRMPVAAHRNDVAQWNEVLPDPKWVYFGDERIRRVLYLALHEGEDVIDEFWHRGTGGMTVFGFGRGPREEGWQRLTRVPAYLTIGFAEDGTFAAASRTINSAYRSVSLSVGPPEQVGSVETEITGVR